MAAEAKKMILLKSSDGETFEVEEKVATMSGTIKHLIEDGIAGGPIPLLNVDGSTLSKVLEYCKTHVKISAAAADEVSAASEIKKWSSEFIAVDQSALLGLITAANYLNIKELMDLVCSTVAGMIRGKTPREIRQMLNIENDFTPEEEAEIERKQAWLG